VRIAFFGDSLTSAMPGSSYFALLREWFPTDTLLNYGKGNDTVVSLYRRISRAKFDKPFDLAFLWIGVNDVTRQASWLSQGANTLMGQRGARDLDEFRQVYQSTLDFLCDWAEKVIAVSPLLRGENLENRWNYKLATLSELIADLAHDRERIEFLDLRGPLAQNLADRAISNYLPRSPIHVILDILTLRSDEQVDKKAAERGLHFTLDGLHLSSAGARLVADAFSDAIRHEQFTTNLA